VDAKSKDSVTPLMRAARFGHKGLFQSGCVRHSPAAAGCTRCLLQFKANVQAKYGQPNREWLTTAAGIVLGTLRCIMPVGLRSPRWPCWLAVAGSSGVVAGVSNSSGSRACWSRGHKQ